LHDATEAFVLTKQIAGCTSATITTYRWWLQRFTAAVGDVTPLSMRHFFVALHHRSASHQHQAFRTLRTFFRWCVETGALAENPLRGFTMRTPKTLPTVPTDDELQAVLTVCPGTREGLRNRALILVLADSGLRASEVLHLLIEDWRPADRGLFVRAGKGRKTA
jgi:site-specific recombinase XerD